jgi:phosphoinositide-3-kinase, regulatory subunit 4
VSPLRLFPFHFLIGITAEREALIDIPNVYNYQAFVETERAGYIIRQWVASNLYDRIR